MNCHARSSEVPEAAIDAMNRRIFAGTSEIASGPLTQLLDSDAADSVGDYYMQRVEFAHFADSNGTDWTGKPEYPQTRLQFDLYFEAWRRAYEILHLTDLDMPLFVSMAKLSPSSSRERWIGTIRQNSSEVLEEGEYPVAAFETEKLARLGDRIRSKGLSSEDGRSEHEVIRDLFEYHEMRKNAFNRFTACMESLRNAERLSAEEYSRVFDLYSDIISFAHVRAAFRRRVAGPMRNEAFQSLPECMRARIEKLVIMASNGLWTETSHRRDPAYQVLLMELSEFPEVMKNLLKVDPARGFDFLWENCPEFASAFEQYLCEYKIERAQTDHLENDLPRARAIQMLQQDLRERKETTLHPLFTRTSAGFLAELEKLRPMILREDPSFDFDTFAGKMLLAWEIPALVDTERHIQHRYQYLLRNFLLKTEAELVQSGELAPGKSIFDLSPAELLDRLSS